MTKNMEDKDMNKILPKDEYKKLNLDTKIIKNISVVPVVKDGKMLYDKNNKNHRYIVEDD